MAPSRTLFASLHNAILLAACAVKPFSSAPPPPPPPPPPSPSHTTVPRLLQTHTTTHKYKSKCHISTLTPARSLMVFSFPLDLKGPRGDARAPALCTHRHAALVDLVRAQDVSHKTLLAVRLRATVEPQIFRAHSPPQYPPGVVHHLVGDDGSRVAAIAFGSDAQL